MEKGFEQSSEITSILPKPENYIEPTEITVFQVQDKIGNPSYSFASEEEARLYIEGLKGKWNGTVELSKMSNVSAGKLPGRMRMGNIIDRVIVE